MRKRCLIDVSTTLCVFKFLAFSQERFVLKIVLEIYRLFFLLHPWIIFDAVHWWLPEIQQSRRLAFFSSQYRSVLVVSLIGSIGY